MTSFKDLDQYLDAELTLPVSGHEYTFAPVSAAFGLRLQRMMRVGMAAAHGDTNEEEVAAAFEDVDDETFYPDLMGDSYQQMLDNGVTLRQLQLVASTVITWNLEGEDAALELWRSGGKAPEPNRAQRRAKTTRTDGASTTKRPASGSGTSTRRKPSASGRKAAG